MMFAARKAALRLLPLLVVVWATFAVLGGALYIAKRSGVPQDSLVEAGIGLCAATVALLAGVRAWRPRRDHADTPSPGARIFRAVAPVARAFPSPPVVSLTRLLQVFRT